MYQVKYPSASAIDKDVVSVSREVFHVPTRSRFVFPNQLRMFKGSDASNVHDEEVGADEIEFSDDEAEAAYKRQLKRKCVFFALCCDAALILLFLDGTGAEEGQSRPAALQLRIHHTSETRK